VAAVGGETDIGIGDAWIGSAVFGFSNLVVTSHGLRSDGGTRS
jgi:hypothetical protein